MVIHAYSDDYLTSAQRILGDMLDIAVNTYDMDIDKFFDMYLVSDYHLFRLVHDYLM